MTQIRRGSSGKLLLDAMKPGRAYTVKQLVDRTGMSRGSVERALLLSQAEVLEGFYPQRWYVGEKPHGVISVVSDDLGLPEVSDADILAQTYPLQTITAELAKVRNGMKNATITSADAKAAAAIWLKLAGLIDSRPDWREYLDGLAHSE